ncbi:class I SAM-dependent methyltransferase [Mycolicibacterium sp. 018/SC-01/001]|uniref:class I SAM-dependent methyltransferase n=1 Tax=Mycolicibacterium sp. 018/SC-01/001 TaxID=2592069 RepID=UPI00117E5030|nr:class I SAM-dependent methyltransferase [Mycolicibacterium sp. 018/SC-01/001]TRW81136.1 class I SAM-dependent methyltransferase [Mycolicibacterium sp. 018/SC-01/001]
MSSSIWAGGRYDAVGDRIAHIATQVVDAVARRIPAAGAEVVDLACGTGSAARAAAAAGAQVTGVDVTPELIDLAAQRAPGITWTVADAADTGLPGSSFDVAVSNMGIIFVDPDRQVAEITRLLKPAGVLSFSAWSRGDSNPLFDPIVDTLGAPAPAPFTPDQWGDERIATQRLASFRDIEFEHGEHRWEFPSVGEALDWLQTGSPMHVAAFARAGSARQELMAAFTTALTRFASPSGAVSVPSPYVVVSAVYRASWRMPRPIASRTTGSAAVASASASTP